MTPSTRVVPLRLPWWRRAVVASGLDLIALGLFSLLFFLRDRGQGDFLYFFLTTSATAVFTVSWLSFWTVSGLPVSFLFRLGHAGLFAVPAMTLLLFLKFFERHHVDRAHGLEALRLLRLEKGHIIVGQDTDFDSTPAKLGLQSAVKMSKPDFVGRSGLSRLATIEPNRVLRAFTFPGPVAPLEGAQLMVGGERVGYLTSSRFSPILGFGTALGWVYGAGAGFPTTVSAVDGTGTSLVGTVTSSPFFDPEGARLRA